MRDGACHPGERMSCAAHAGTRPDEARRQTRQEESIKYVYVGRNEIVALVVGLVTGFLYSWLDLPIPAPNVLGGILAIIFTYVGYVIVKLFRKQLTFGRPASSEIRSEA